MSELERCRCAACMSPSERLSQEIRDLTAEMQAWTDARRRRSTLAAAPIQGEQR